MGLIQNASAQALPLTLDEMKAHLRLTTDSENVALDAYIQAATALAECDLNRSLITQTWKLYLDRFPSQYFYATQRLPDRCADDTLDRMAIRLEKPPVLSVEKLYYVDVNGAEQTLSTTLYQVDLVSTFPRILPAYNQTWPQTREVPNAIRIEYTAGYGATGEHVPADIRQAMKLIVAGMFTARAALSVTDYKELPGGFAAAALLSRHRLMRFN